MSVLFDGIHRVSKEDVTEKMNYFINKAEIGMKFYDEDRKTAVEFARELRSELEKEYKNNNLRRIRELYKDEDNLLERYYAPAVHRAYVSITGMTTVNNARHFLYDVKSYMRTYLPRDN